MVWHQSSTRLMARPPVAQDDEKADELRIQSIKREEAVRVQAQVDVAVRAEKVRPRPSF